MTAAIRIAALLIGTACIWGWAAEDLSSRWLLCVGISSLAVWAAIAGDRE